MDISVAVVMVVVASSAAIPTITPQRASGAIRRGTFTSVKDLITAIENFIDGWNDRCTPFIWTKTADQILTKAHRKTTSNTRH